MLRRSFLLGALALATAALGTTSPAEAGLKRCVYMAHDPSGQKMADGWAHASSKDRACDRARRRCNRELERKRRHGKAGRGQCRRITNL